MKQTKTLTSCDILYVHHEDGEVELQNYLSFVKFAPAWCKVIAVHIIDGCTSHLPFSVGIHLNNFPRNNADGISGIWSETDLVIIAWSEQILSSSEFFVQVEYDVHAHAPLDDLLEICGSADCAANHHHFPLDGYWKERHENVKGEEWISGKSQMIPLAFRSLSKHSCIAIAEELRSNPEWHDVYCEVRAASIQEHLGLYTFYFNAPWHTFWWQGPGIYEAGNWFPLTHPSKNVLNNA